MNGVQQMIFAVWLRELSLFESRDVGEDACGAGELLRQSALWLVGTVYSGTA
jgi:hypothetical protein